MYSEKKLAWIVIAKSTIMCTFVSPMKQKYSYFCANTSCAENCASESHYIPKITQECQEVLYKEKDNFTSRPTVTYPMKIKDLSNHRDLCNVQYTDLSSGGDVIIFASGSEDYKNQVKGNQTKYKKLLVL